MVYSGICHDLLFLRAIFPPASSPSAYDQGTAADLSADLKILVENYQYELGRETTMRKPDGMSEEILAFHGGKAAGKMR
ncbi:MAG: hypothetical protein DI558_11850 [Corynebacterium propinquum]|nr:MAG: hypothetical protein DI558_11850 [Corynebacterium propinquum]